MNEDFNTIGRLTKVASVDIGPEGKTTLWVVRHYTGSGASTKLIEVHVIRNQKFLGRFEVQEQPTFDVAWQATKEHSAPATEADLLLFRKARMALLGVVDKLWTDSNS